MSNLDVWYSRLDDRERCCADCGAQFKPRAVKRAEKNLAKAARRTACTAFSKLTHVVDGKPGSSTSRR